LAGDFRDQSDAPGVGWAPPTMTYAWSSFLAAKYCGDRVALANSVDPTFIRKLYEFIIKEACRLEDIIIDEA